MGTYHPVIRLYDIETFNCYVSANPADQHKGPINCVAYSPNGNMYSSGSKDGSIKVSISVQFRTRMEWRRRFSPLVERYRNKNAISITPSVCCHLICCSFLKIVDVGWC